MLPAAALILVAALAGLSAGQNHQLNVTIPSTVAADQETTVTFSTDAAASVLDQTVGVLLYTAVSNWFVCKLVTHPPCTNVV